MLGVTLAFAVGLPLFFLLDFLHTRPCKTTRMYLRKAAKLSPRDRKRFLNEQIQFYRDELARKRRERIQRAIERRERFPFNLFHECRVRFCNVSRFFSRLF